MTATPTKKKLCWNCDGNVPLRAEHCPYCGVYIEQSGDLDEPEEEDHAPPYVMSSPQKANAQASAPTPPYSSRLKKSKTPSPEPKAARPATRSDSNEPLRQVVAPLLLLICGSVFALFGLVLLLFSDNGVFVLKWNGDHWPFYLVAGLLALAIGWRLIGKVDETSA